MALLLPWLRMPLLEAWLGDAALLRLCVVALALLAALQWGESARQRAMLTGLLTALRALRQSAPSAPRAADAATQLEAAKLLLAAMRSADAEVRRLGHQNLVAMAGEDHGQDPAAWQAWLERHSALASTR